MPLKPFAKEILGLLDLTTLNDSDTDEVVIELCKKAHTNYGNVAAICIYRQFIPTAKNYFAKHNLAIKIATVTNFPHGNEDIELALRETEEAIKLGADEIDLVFPYQALISGKPQIGEEMVSQAKKICQEKQLKVILETGTLQEGHLIETASEVAIANGADFIKTSTGKVAINATLSAASVMLKTIRKTNSKCGFKAAGGIRLVSEAKEYLQLASTIMGNNWISPDRFRFGASSLLTDVLNILNDQASVNTNSGY